MNPKLNPKFDMDLNPKRRNLFSVRALLIACGVIAAGAAAMHRYGHRPAERQAVVQLTAAQRAELAPAEAAPTQAAPPAAPPDGAGLGEEDLAPPPEDGSGS